MGFSPAFLAAFFLTGLAGVGRGLGGLLGEAQRAQPGGVGVDRRRLRVILGHGLLGVFGLLQLAQPVVRFLVGHVYLPRVYRFTAKSPCSTEI